MQSEVRAEGGRRLALRYVAGALIVYGAVGVLTHLRLFSLPVTGLVGWFGLPSGESAPMLIGVFEPLRAHFDGTPWLPWAAWLAGVGLLTFKVPPAVDAEELAPSEPSGSRFRSWLLPGAVLAVLLLVSGFARMVLLLPQDAGLIERPYDDEGVYAGASQLFIQGIMPYRDYFFAHPPVAAFSYAPAMAYHFTEWGSPTSFLMARYLSVGYSLVTLVLLFFIGMRLAGLTGGSVAGLLWALDGRVVEINRKVMLDGPMVLLSCAALLAYLLARPYLTGEASAPRRRSLWLLGMAGLFGALSTLTKIAGVACLLAILADMAWLWATYRLSSKQGDATRRVRSGLICAVSGAVVAALAVLTPFLVVAPSEFLRDVFFFQLLRPGDGIEQIPARIGDLTATLRNPVTILFAALGFLVLSLSVWLRRATGAWWVVAIWMFFSILLLTYSRSFYQHYYIQLAAPLCLLGAAVSLLPEVARPFLPRVSASSRRVFQVAVPALLALVLLPLLAVQWTWIVTPRPDDIFEVVARYANNAVPPGTPVLSTDEQFNILAARPPSRNETGYLVDSYGHMISLGLGLNSRDMGELWSAVLSGRKEERPEGERPDVYGILYRPAPQADFLDRASRVPLVVVHETGFNRLTPETQQALAESTPPVVQQTRYSIFRAAVR